MLRNRLSGVFIAIFCILSGSGLFAGEVALVTSVKGIVQAELASESWEVEIAEMLPDGVEIKVSSDGSLVLVHLPTSYEYRFSAESSAVISQAGVIGDKFASSAIQLVSSDVNLNREMGNQTGAVNPERVGASSLRGSGRPQASAPAPAPVPAPILAPPPPPVGAEPMNDSFNKGSDFDSGNLIAPEQKPAENLDSIPAASSEKSVELAMQEMKMSAESAMNEEKARREKTAKDSAASIKSENKSEVDEEAQEQAASSGISGFAADAETDVAGPQAPSVTLAMPAEIFAKICTDETSFKVSGDKVADKALDFPIEHWVSIKLLYGTEGYDNAIVLNGNVGSMSIEIADPVPATIVAAWKLEKSGRLYQAAALWLELLQTGMPVKNITPHLNRIKAQILNLN